METAADLVAEAVRTCDAAAERAGVRLAEVAGIEPARAASDLFDTVWGLPPGAMLAPEALVAMADAGCQVTAAHDVRSGDLLGATGAFLGRDHDDGALFLHSHATGVLDGATGRGVGLALKRHQRAWALTRGIHEVRWTYDPLIRRNAWFNLARLGARPTGFEEDRYGRRDDRRNAGLPSHRFTVSWRLDDRRVVLAAEDRINEPDVQRLRGAGAEVLLDVGPDGAPQIGPTHADRLLARVPEDVETLRRDDPTTARAWSDALPATLGAALEHGHRVVGCTRDGWYVLVRDERRELT